METIRPQESVVQVSGRLRVSRKVEKVKQIGNKNVA